MTLRDEDKQFIAKVYAYIFIGVMLDWIKNDMRKNLQRSSAGWGKSPQAPSHDHFAVPVIKGTLHKTLSQYLYKRASGDFVQYYLDLPFRIFDRIFETF